MSNPEKFMNLAHPVRATAVTPSDTTDLPRAAVIYTGAGGDIAVIPQGQSTAVTFTNVAAGDILAQGLQVDRVMSTNTTATDMVALY